MASFDPTAVIFGSITSITAANLRLPVSLLFAFDVKSLEEIVSNTPQLSEICLRRYFVVLLEPIEEDLLMRLKENHRVVAVYNRYMMCTNNQTQLNRMTNSFKQLTLDISDDIVRFLTAEGVKQTKLERLSLVKIYYQQARVLKEWTMSFFKAEPCHILLIPLNSSQANLDSAQQRLQKICTKIGYNSTMIRQFSDYVPSSDKHLALMPYANLLFGNDDPYYILEIIKQLSPIRFYLYGNKLCYLDGWSKLMIDTEINIMDDEDNWCAFLENEFIDNEVKWNFAFMYGRQWKVSRVAPLDFDRLDDNPRFKSALRRAHITFADRQIEVTARIFDWYTNCIELGYLHVEPKLSQSEETKKTNLHRAKLESRPLRKFPFQNNSFFDYSRLDSLKIKSVSFIWLDKILQDSEDEFHRIIEPFQWKFFDKISNCISYIETQLREQRYIFLIVSGSLGNELFLAGLCLINQLFSTYVYCAKLDTHLNWTKQYTQIRGTYNDPTKLAEQIKQDYNQLRIALSNNESEWYIGSNTTNENMILQQTKDVESLLPLPLTVYNSEEAHEFMAHQRTIDTLVCMPCTSESKQEMLAEFRRIFNDNQAVLSEIDEFEKTYHSGTAVQWYTRDSFVCRTINQALRSSNVDTMFKLRYILTDLYDHLYETYKQKHSLFHQTWTPIETFYRGQLMSSKEFDYFKELRGSIISINTFLSTTTSMQIALMYAGKYHENPDLISIVFTIEIEPSVHTRPYANISHFSLFPDEDETLFAMGSVFRVGNIRQMPNADNIWIIHLKMIDYKAIDSA